LKLETDFNDRFILGEERWAPFAGGHRMRYLYLKAQRPSDKPPVVFIHGLLGYSFSWRFNLEEFSRERDVYAIDLLGIGDSDRPPREAFSFSLPESARRVLDWIRELGLTDIDLIGTSHGGAVSMWMAVFDRQQKTNSIGRLVLVAPANPISKTGRKRIMLFNTAFGEWLLRNTGGIKRIKDLSLERMYGNRKLLTQATRDGYARILVHPLTIDYALGIIKTWHADMRDLLIQLPHIADIPTLMIWGERDITVPTRTAAELIKHFRRASLVILPRSGHLPYEEDPGLFNPTVLGWLDQSGKAGD
jgi:pimeloyl-ACP methyl ester carboxylesterase